MKKHQKSKTRRHSRFGGRRRPAGGDPAITAGGDGGGRGEIFLIVICHPDQKLHQLFEVRPASWKEELSGANAARKVKRAADLELVHGEYEGNELQLPVSGNSRKKP